MTTKGKKIILATSLLIAASGIGFLIYKRQVNKRNSGLMLEYIGELPEEINKTKAVEYGIDNVQNTKLDTNKMAILGLKGAYSNPLIKSSILKITRDLYNAMAVPSTKVDDFFKALYSIKNQNTLLFIDKLYGSIHGKTLFEDMKDEVALNSKIFNYYKAPETAWYNVPSLLGDAKWNPKIADYLNKLPKY